jgi:hypothetical protein
MPVNTEPRRDGVGSLAITGTTKGTKCLGNGGSLRTVVIHSSWAAVSCGRLVAPLHMLKAIYPGQINALRSQLMSKS